MVYISRRAYRPFTPPTDVIELADKIVILVEIAGIRAEDLKITLLNQNLLITGFRERPRHSGPAYHQVEIVYGEFRIEVVLPWPVDSDSVSANYQDGFLTVELPRKAARQIPIAELKTAEKQDNS